MELYEAIEKRKTTRQFLDKEVDFEVIQRILKAGTKAPTWDHNRRWEFIVLHMGLCLHSAAPHSASHDLLRMERERKNNI